MWESSIDYLNIHLLTSLPKQKSIKYTYYIRMGQDKTTSFFEVGYKQKENSNRTDSTVPKIPLLKAEEKGRPRKQYIYLSSYF